MEKRRRAKVRTKLSFELSRAPDKPMQEKRLKRGINREERRDEG
jgi:hypothetical protein